MVKSPSEAHKGQSTGVDGHEEMDTCLILTPLNMTFWWGLISLQVYQYLH